MHYLLFLQENLDPNLFLNNFADLLSTKIVDVCKYMDIFLNVLLLMLDKPPKFHHDGVNKTDFRGAEGRNE